MTIWFATGNLHKKRELAAIFSGHTIRTPKDAGIAFEIEEAGSTFGENALLKARSLCRLTGEPALADDSGLCVDALGGRPGIFSARYGSIDRYGNGEGRKLGDRERNALLLAELGDASRRSARFVCAMALVFSEERFYLIQETLEGDILREERGGGGFGYDPLFYLPELGRSAAELSEEEKNRVSHRGKAGRALAKLLAET